MGIENEFVPPVEIPPRIISGCFFLRQRHTASDQRRVGWHLSLLANMGLIAPKGFEDVTQVEITPIDGGEPMGVKVHAIPIKGIVAFVPVDDIPIQPYRVRIQERFAEFPRTGLEDRFITTIDFNLYIDEK